MTKADQTREILYTLETETQLIAFLQSLANDPSVKNGAVEYKEKPDGDFIIFVFVDNSYFIFDNDIADDGLKFQTGNDISDLGEAHRVH